jgi:outer membrane protein W
MTCMAAAAAAAAAAAESVAHQAGSSVQHQRLSKCKANQQTNFSKQPQPHCRVAKAFIGLLLNFTFRAIIRYFSVFSTQTHSHSLNQQVPP